VSIIKGGVKGKRLSSGRGPNVLSTRPPCQAQCLMPKRMTRPWAQPQMRDIGLRLQLVRTMAGLTQQQVADLLECDKSTITHWEGGRRLPDPLAMLQLGSTLGVTLDYIYSGRVDTLSQQMIRQLAVIRPSIEASNPAEPRRRGRKPKVP
jgi:transcriptional regulator with XRE-family HTH domain